MHGCKVDHAKDGSNQPIDGLNICSKLWGNDGFTQSD
mgnify:FL=1